MDIAKDKRLKRIHEVYKPMMELYNKKINVIGSIELSEYDSFELSVCKVYLILSDIKKTVEQLKKMGYTVKPIYRKEPKKVRVEDVMEVLRNIKNGEEDIYKSLARLQYKENGGII